jgi:hypothetical protein
MCTAEPYALLSALQDLENVREQASAKHGRQYKRFAIRGEAELRPMHRIDTDAGTVTVLLRDIGRGGVGFICDQRMELNSVWRVCFYQRGYMIGHQAVIIKHCRSIKPGVWLAGAEFCIETGLMVLLGIEPTDIRRGDLPETAQTEAFLPPGEVA